MINKIILKRSLIQNPLSSTKKKKAYFKEAYSTLEEDLKELPLSEQIILLRDVAILAKRAIEFKISIELYKRAIKLEPRDPMNYYNLGKTLFLDKKYKQSLKSYLMAYELGVGYEVKDINLLSHLGHILMTLTGYKEQEDIYRKSLIGLRSKFDMSKKTQDIADTWGDIILQAYKGKHLYYTDEITEEEWKTIFNEIKMAADIGEEKFKQTCTDSPCILFRDEKLGVVLFIGKFPDEH